ncbi:protein-glutamine gamma-glutamyltransferase [Oceanobacillus chungangensis]|uniref:Protein-glutamine gamma-glutamyltransferase n=1 Tax=Oceanobacillus chungangensis TaxID=1229152 RepID=A0A3D8PWU5_9BACI|nr:protein-glutamine gamma-glutamyltransferase [Oceanobacillus chungangensis]RDW20494.1 protein-glutamine gamma-glutamyltransferase [Oceanobacillus chungangensis]
MIQLAGMQFQQSGMWTSDSIENVIIQRMQEDPIVHSYQSMDELSFELKLRKNIIESSRSMYQGNSQFASLENSRCNPQYWLLTDAGGFRLRDDVKPSDAIRDIYKNSSLYEFECATAIIIIYYHAVLKSIDEHLFNQLFQNLYLYSWHSESDLGIHDIKTSHFLPGDVVYFNNPDFNLETPWWRGENAVLLEDGTYFGHGIGIGNAKQMIQALNKTRMPGSNQSAYLENSVTRLSFKHLAKYSMLPRGYINHKIQPILFHHNESSISYDRYLYYLNMIYNQINDINLFP